MLYIILVFIICIILINCFPALSSVIFQVILEIYLQLIFKEMMSMKKNTHGVSSSYICVDNKCDIYKLIIILKVI